MSIDTSKEVLREYALNNLRAVVAGLREYDRQSTAAERAKAIPKGWRPDRLLAAAQWAQIAEALRSEPVIHYELAFAEPEPEKQNQ